MKISVRWLNEYLDPANVTAHSAEEALTNAGFPIETSVEHPNGDVMLDVEVTSNRGDCISHIGLAREVAASTGRRLRMPAIPDLSQGLSAAGGPVGSGSMTAAQAVRVDNRVPTVCSMFTARVIKGVKIGPSPAWLVEALQAIGQRSINNIVDITNYVLHEFGQPLHAFDLGKVAKGADGVPSIIVRYATPGEKLTLLDGKTVELKPDELVVADAKGAASLAGIMGGRGSEVTESTVDVLLEAATWDPVTIRRACRRLLVRTDSSYRFERTVDPRTIEIASRRAAELMVRLGGPNAKLLPGVTQSGTTLGALAKVSLRPDRCRSILGYDLPTADITRALKSHEIQVTGSEPTLECVIPAHRPDLEREIDLIEEVARTAGLARIPILEKLPVRVSPPQPGERAMRDLGAALNGLGFFESITFSFVSPKQAAPFLSKDVEMLQLCDERRKADPVLRPSVIPSLLACRRANQDSGASAPGGVRLFETASVFSQAPATAAKNGSGPSRGKEIERRVLALYADVASPTGAKGFDMKQEAFRFMTGVAQSIATALGGMHVKVSVVPGEMQVSGLDSAAAGWLTVQGRTGSPARMGYVGLVASSVIQSYDLDSPAVVAELDLEGLLKLFPPASIATALPQFPGIERDLSLIVPENTPWAGIDRLVAEARLDRIDGWEFITTYRGTYRDSSNSEHSLSKSGKKAVTVRLKFRDPARTLRHEEVDSQVATLVRLAAERFGAELRN